MNTPAPITSAQNSSSNTAPSTQTSTTNPIQINAMIPSTLIRVCMAISSAGTDLPADLSSHPSGRSGIGVTPDLRTSCSPPRRQEAHPVVYLPHGLAGDLASPLGTPDQQLVQLGWVIEVAGHLLAQRRDEVGEHLGDVRLQLPVALAGIGCHEIVDGASGHRRVDHQQVRDASLGDRIVVDLPSGVGDR